MIVSFRSRALKRFWEKSDARGLNPQHVRKLERILTLLERAIAPEDLQQPGFDFHRLSGDNPTRWSVHVNGNWCVTFAFESHDAVAVDYEDYY
jgi:proteic killer suppression protein